MARPSPQVPNRERGIVLVLFTVGTLAIVAIAGLALDLGLAYLARARLQNALDAAALSGAKTLNKTFDDDLAVAAAEATYLLNQSGLVESVTPVVEVSPTLSPFDVGGLEPRFVRVTITAMPSPLRFASVLPGIGSSLDLGGVAVAGPIPLGGEICNAIPIALCGAVGDSDCSDGSCFGFPAGEFEIKGDSNRLGPGNYGLVTLDCRGGDCLRTHMAGGGKFCYDDDGGEVTTEPGVSAGPTAQGLNTRFNLYQGPVSAAEYPGDVVTVPAISYANYQGLLAAGVWNNPGGVPQRRVVPAPVIDCSTPVTGRSNVPVMGTACLFLTRPVLMIGGGTVYAEVAPSCMTEGEVPEDPGESTAYEIVLYQNVPGA